MKTIKDLKDEEIRQGIIRCEYRLAFHDYGLLKTEKRTREALSEYRTEFQRRGQLEFKDNG